MQTRDDVMAYCQSLFHGKLIREYSHVWNGLVTTCTDLYPEEVYEDIKQAYREELVHPSFINLNSVEEVLTRGKEHVLNALHNNRRRRLIDDTIGALEWWACFQPKDRSPRPVVSDVQPRTGTPMVQPLMKKSKHNTKDKYKRKLAKASRRKNRR